MPDYRVPIGCEGLDMEGRGRYGASRDGRITVDNPEHARHIEKVGHGNGHIIHRIVYGASPGTSSRICPVCDFVGYGWQRNCPRGHGEMPFGIPGRKPVPAAAEGGDLT